MPKNCYREWISNVTNNFFFYLQRKLCTINLSRICRKPYQNVLQWMINVINTTRFDLNSLKRFGFLFDSHLVHLNYIVFYNQIKPFSVVVVVFWCMWNKGRCSFGSITKEMLKPKSGCVHWICLNVDLIAIKNSQFQFDSLFQLHMFQIVIHCARRIRN